MYGIPYSQLTARQKRILHEDSLRRAKLIDEREQAVLKNGLKAFDDEAKMERVLASIYRDCQKSILADMQETLAKVQKDGGTWSYANASALTRSRGLFEQISKELSILGQKEQATFYSGLSNIFTDQYLRQVYTLGQYTAVKVNLNRLNPALIKQTLDYPWSGAMFSDRLWNDKEKLGRNLRIGLTQSMILGEGIPQITDRINKGIETSRYNAERVARSEVKRVSYVAHDAVYQDTGVEELEYRCANGGDNRTCDLCRADNGKHYKRGEEPTLPRHPNCRCIYIPVVSDTFAPNELNELTGSVRGAENYEKWVQDNADKLNPDGTLKEGWVRDWKNGGKLIYKGDPEALKTGVKSDKVIQMEKEKADVQMQIDTKNEEYKNVPSVYQPQIDGIEAKKADLQAKHDSKRAEADAKQAELNKAQDQYEKLINKRDALRLEYEDQKISEDDYYKKRDDLRADIKAVRDRINSVEAEYYSIWEMVNKYAVEIQDCNRDLQIISNNISTDRLSIQASINALTKKLGKLDDEIMLYLRYQGHSDTFVEVMRNVEACKVKAKAVGLLSKELTEEEIIDRLAGGDMTKGSCSSLAFSYIGNKSGLDVIDFRGGGSQECFSSNSVIQAISKLGGVQSSITMVKKEVADTAKLLKSIEKGKEYYLATGRHAAIVRLTDNGLEYLELQSKIQNGWTSFNRYGSISDTLYRRFGCRKTIDKMKIGDTSLVFEKSVVLMDVSSFEGNSEFREILSYINTDPDKQKKGAAGDVK